MKYLDIDLVEDRAKRFSYEVAVVYLKLHTVLTYKSCRLRAIALAREDPDSHLAKTILKLGLSFKD